MSISDIRYKHVTVNFWVGYKELPEHSAFDVELTLLAIVVDDSLVHDTFIALRD